MTKKQLDPLEELKHRFLRKKPILWLVYAVFLIGGIAALFENLQSIIVFLKPRTSLSIVSFGLDTDECIFEEEISEGIQYFKIPRRMRRIITHLFLSNTDEDYIFNVLTHMEPALDHLFFIYQSSNISISSNELNAIFQDKNKPALLKLIIPTDLKSPKYAELNESRLELFNIVTKLLTKEDMKEASRYVRDHVKPFRPLMMGRLEPIFKLTLHNDGARTAIVNEIDIEVKEALPKAAPIPSGPVPVVEIVDISLPSRPGIYQTRLSDVIQIAPDTSVVIPIRITPESESLYDYLLKIVIKGPEVDVSTEYFGLEM